MADLHRFGEFELDVAAYVLRRNSEPLKLEKMPMEVLILLVSSAGNLVARDDIQAALWKPDVFVERDAAINTAIRKIRQTLDDSVEYPRFVQTVVGKGYRFIAPVEREGSGSEPSSGRWRQLYPRFVVTRGTREFALNLGQNVMGRDPTATVYIDHESVSRRHALISISSECAVIEDLKSRNGTFIDGRRVDAPIEIRNGAIIGLGPITLTLVVLSGPASTKPLSTSEVGRLRS